MKVTLREYLHSLNVVNKDVDIYIDGDVVEIAICPPIKLTPAGEEKWGNLLDNKDIYVDTEISMVMSDNEHDYESHGNLCEVEKFITYLAGFCPTSKYDEWFDGDDAKLV